MSYREMRQIVKDRKAAQRDGTYEPSEPTPWPPPPRQEGPVRLEADFGSAEYLGGLPKYPSLYQPRIVADSDGLAISFTISSKKATVLIPWCDVRDIEISDSSDTSRRHTFARWAVAGPVAILLPKEETTKASLLLVELVDGTKFGFKFDSRSPHGCSVPEIKVKLARFYRPAA
ncbi:MAG: hypothetical protein QOE80_3046, partial [Actinomycetota bacterium]|nr:hypothetical protein [Actinomycetota bacterium]